MKAIIPIKLNFKTYKIPINTHKHTYTVYIYMCVCVLACMKYIFSSPLPAYL
jgi:hypothetical protein